MAKTARSEGIFETQGSELEKLRAEIERLAEKIRVLCQPSDELAP
jgi:hypothetical protein